MIVTQIQQYHQFSVYLWPQSLLLLIIYDSVSVGKFYLLHDGADNPECGASPEVACRTFPYLLQVFHKKYNSSLDITTDVSVVIDNSLQVSVQFDLLSCLG